MIPPIKTSIVEKTSTTFLDAYQITTSIVPSTSTNNNNNNMTNNSTNNNNTNAPKSKSGNHNEKEPLVTYETSGEGKKNL